MAAGFLLSDAWRALSEIIFWAHDLYRKGSQLFGITL
jgi:hypothetical protein